MADYIEYNGDLDDFFISKEIEKHKQKFGIEPYIIGMFWNDIDTLIDNIIKAIEDNKPYNEYEMLTDDEKKAFDNGSLVF